MVIHDIDHAPVGLAGYRVLFTHSSEGVLFSTPDGRITAANPAACAMLDMAAEEICALGATAWSTRRTPAGGWPWPNGSERGSAVGVARLRRGDGRFIEIEMTTLQFRAEDGASQTCCILHDMTGRLAIERELEELSARLLAAVAGRRAHRLQQPPRADRAGTAAPAVRRPPRTPTVHALFVDVGNVQELNERLGHQAGDAALQAVARALSVTFRKNDVLARVGGTQFLVLTLHLERVRLRRRHRPHPGPPRRPVTRRSSVRPVEVSCGWTTRQGGERTSLEDLVARSDWAMLESREGAAFGPPGPELAPPPPTDP